MSKTELIIPEKKNGALSVESCVRFDAKINTGDLIDAVVFETEEDLLNKVKDLRKKNADESKIYTKINNSINEYLDAFNKKYKNKEIDAFVKQLMTFTQQKCKAIYISNIEDEKLCIDTRISIDRYNQFTKKIKIDLPKDLATMQDKLKKSGEIMGKYNSLIDATNLKLDEIPRLKKRIKTSFVKTLVGEDIKDGKTMLAKLREEIEKVKAE